MDLRKKQQLYEMLIKYLKEDYKNRSLQKAGSGNQNYAKKPVVVEGCDYLGNQINLWSYWQGSLNANILLVGQDWGTVNPKSDNDIIRNERTKENVQKIDRGEPAGYFDGIDEKIRFKTDNFIIELFKALGNEYGDVTRKNNDLFFTNLCLGYRSEGNSQGFRVKWLRDDVKYLSGFDEGEGDKVKHISGLLEIIKPDVVICLGKKAYEVLAQQYDKALYDDIKNGTPKLAKSDFFKRLEQKCNYITVQIEDKEVRIYGVAHPGPQGIANRLSKSKDSNKIEAKEDNKKDGKTLQLEDWQNIGEWLQSRK